MHSAFWLLLHHHALPVEDLLSAAISSVPGGCHPARGKFLTRGVAFQMLALWLPKPLLPMKHRLVEADIALRAIQIVLPDQRTHQVPKNSTAELGPTDEYSVSLFYDKESHVAQLLSKMP